MPQSKEVFGDLLVSASSTSASTDDAEVDEEEEEESGKELKAGWEARLLRHHEKIIRAKNNSSCSGSTTATSTTNAQQQPLATSTPSSIDASKKTTQSKTAVPPPKLISVLRQLYDSPSSSDLKGILSNPSGGEVGSGGKSESQQQVNVLPSLLHSVISHPAFSSEPSSSSSSAEEDRTSNVKRHLASLFHSPREMKEEEGKATEETSSDDNNNNNTPTIAEIGPPPAANLEAIIGNVCRDVYMSSKSKSDNSGDNNRHIQGLLIASLSILTGSLSEEDTLEDVSSTALELGSGPMMSTGAVPKSSDSSWNATPEPYLQVGGLLTLLNNVQHSTRSCCGEDFLVDPSLSRYFAEASSVYEERIEIQKAALLQSGSPSTKGATTNEFSTPKNYLKMESGDDSLDSDSPLPPLSSRISGHHSGDDSDDVIDLVAEGAPDDDGLPTSRHNSDLTNDEVANVTQMLLNNIANIVGGDVSRDVLDFHDVIMDEIEELDADEGEMDEDEEHRESDDDEDEEDDHQNMSDDDSEVTREFLGAETSVANEDTETAVDAEINSQEAAGANEDAENETQEAADAIEGDRNNQDDEETYNDDSENNDDERVMLQRALALSLTAATTSSGGSDGSNSDNAEDDRKISAIRPPSERRNPKNEEFKRKSSGGSTESGATNANLPPFPAPPSKDILPFSSLNDLSESEVTSLLDPTKLSSFGGVPSSHVLVQFLQILLGTLDMKEESATAAPSPMETPVSSMKKSTRKWKDESTPKDATKGEKREFMPDSVTSQLLVATLQLSNYLRQCSIGALNDILSEKQNEAKESAEEGDDKEKTIQIANSAESEDPLDEDPVLIIAAETALENKGFERKSAALADITALRQTTKEKMVGIWTERAAFYSVCCYLCMKALRILMSKCVQHGLRFIDSADSSCGDAIYMSTKSRNEIAAILASFHSISTPATFGSLQDAMDIFFESNIDESKQLFDELHVSTLCSESLLLWGVSIPFICPDHRARLELLRELIGGRFSPRNTESCGFDMNKIIESMDWNATNMQNMKLNVLCRRLRMSDMLDCFVPQPRVQQSTSLDSTLDQDLFTASLNAVRMLGEQISSKGSLPNVSQLYFAICGRAIRSLILWNDLALSPSESIDQDIHSLKVELDPEFIFDPSKCADSIAIAQPHTTANQRAAKVWGSVLSSTYFLPKSGIHRFAVKLDKCERGHIFVGVATARANTKSYVGGDKNGWGFIGTQALWHDR